ncbi:MAG: DHH family phosphoesterase, partial [Parcubacteria group bacterium]|nr:DHH family phosphoesterase [Parcubacteria group bacterium]
SPDFDAVSSALALGRILHALGRKPTLYIPAFEPEKWEELPEAKKIQSKLPERKVDLVFGVDYARMDRVGVEPLLLRDEPFFVSIDHHPPQDQKGDVVWIDPSKAATAEMIYDLSRAWKVKIDPQTAFLLTLGIVGDTVGLSVEGSPRLLKVVADLVKAGADLSKAQTLYDEWSSLHELQLLGQVASRGHFDKKLGFAYSFVTKRDKEKFREAADRSSQSENTSRFANILRSVRGVEISLILVEENGSWYGHLRSRQESKVDLGKIANHFGGGGHVHAAGLKTKLPKSRIISEIKKLLRKAKRK